MVIQTIVVDTKLGNNVANIMLYGTEINSLENEQFRKIGFNVQYNQHTKEFMQTKVENFIPETSQLVYLKGLMQRIHDKSWFGGDFTYAPGFTILYKGKDKTVNFTEKVK